MRQKKVSKGPWPGKIPTGGTKREISLAKNVSHKTFSMNYHNQWRCTCRPFATLWRGYYDHASWHNPKQPFHLPPALWAGNHRRGRRSVISRTRWGEWGEQTHDHPDYNGLLKRMQRTVLRYIRITGNGDIKEPVYDYYVLTEVLPLYWKVL